MTCTTEKIKAEGNFVDTCRVCMYKQLEMTNIFDENCDIVGKILYCTGLQITKEDGLPSQICKNCVQDLATAYKFKSSCILAHDTYQNLLKSEIKTELELDYDDRDGFVENNEFFNIKDELIKSEEELNINGDDPQQVLLPSRPVSPVLKPRKYGPGSRGPYKRKLNPNPKTKKKKIGIYCVSCKLTFRSKAEKDEHQKSIHNVKTETETWICEHCGKLFRNKASMYSHTFTHLPPKYNCDQCDYKATFKHDLAKHKLIHAGLKLFQCQMCATRFRTASGLSQHIQREHERKPKKFQCELCEKAFFDRTKYSRHMDSHNNIKRFECEICHSSFTRRCYWKKHREQKHNIVIPRQRPGRQRVNLVLGAGDDHSQTVVT